MSMRYLGLAIVVIWFLVALDDKRQPTPVKPVIPKTLFGGTIV